MPQFDFKPHWSDAVAYGAWLAHAPAMLANPKLAATCQQQLATYTSANLLPKRTTIRKAGRARVGQELHLYTGLRTKACKKLGTVLCISKTPLLLVRDQPLFILYGHHLNTVESEMLARLDTAGAWGHEQCYEFLVKTYGYEEGLALYGW